MPIFYPEINIQGKKLAKNDPTVYTNYQITEIEGISPPPSPTHIYTQEVGKSFHILILMRNLK